MFPATPPAVGRTNRRSEPDRSGKTESRSASLRGPGNVIMRASITTRRNHPVNRREIEMAKKASKAKKSMKDLTVSKKSATKVKAGAASMNKRPLR